MNKIKLLAIYLVLFIAPARIHKALVFKYLRKQNFNSLPNVEPELLLLKYFLKKEDVFFDIGASIGVYAYQASRNVHERNIYAFEPIPESFNQLKRSFPKANLHNLAFSGSRKDGKTKFKIPIIKGDLTKARGTLNIGYREEDESSYRIIEVPVSTVDDFVQRNTLDRLDFMKIDVEGHEEEVLKGASDTVSKFKPVMQIEIEQRHHDFPIARIFERLKAIGYECFYFHPELLKLFIQRGDPEDLQLKENLKTSFYIRNFYFFHRENFDFTLVNKINSAIEAQMTEKDMHSVKH